MMKRRCNTLGEGWKPSMYVLVGGQPATIRLARLEAAGGKPEYIAAAKETTLIIERLLQQMTHER